MSIDSLAASASREIVGLSDLSAAQEAQVRRIVERALVEAIRATTQECRDAAASCCRKDSEITRQLHEEMHRAEAALIANLSGMR